MTELRHREIACAILVDTFGRLLLQRRDDIPGILFPGRIGLFGGHREGNETFLECVVREIYEETSYYVPPERFMLLARHEGNDPEVENGTVRSEFLFARHIPVEDLMITEGALLIAKPSELVAIEPQFYPGVTFCIRRVPKKMALKHPGACALGTIRVLEACTKCGHTSYLSLAVGSDMCAPSDHS